MDRLIELFNSIQLHKSEVKIGIVVGCIILSAVVVVCYKNRNSTVIRRLWKWRQGFFNLFVLIALFGAGAFAVLVIKDSSPKTVQIGEIAGVNYSPQQTNLYDPAGCEDFFYDYDGTIIESQNGSVMSNWIACQPGQAITRNGIATNVVCYFDAEKKFLERVDSYGMKTVVAPQNDQIAYVRMAVQPSPERVIVYGTAISDLSISSDYYTIPKLKIYDYNLSKDYTVIESPDGKQWKITVDNAGNLSAKDVTGTIFANELPADFPKFEIIGTSVTSDDYLVTVYGMTEAGYNYIFVMTNQGDITWYKQVPNYAYNFRKIEYKDGTIRYAYQQLMETNSEKSNGGVNFTKIILMDDKFNVINDNIHPFPYGSITGNEYYCENHDYKILGDNHFLLLTYTFVTAYDVPGFEGKAVKVTNAVLQEQKDGKVVMQWESVEHPELYSASLQYNNYADYADTQKDEYTDYVHANAIAIDPNTYDILLSCRHIGLIKIDRETGAVLWVMGRNRNDIEGLQPEQIGLLQHDVRYLADGSFTIFDNSGGINEESRVCRYWVDEEQKKLINFEEFGSQNKSGSMGSAELLDDETDTYLICYGAANGVSLQYTFEEIDFSKKKANVQFSFLNGELIYRIFKGVERTPTP